MRGCACRVRSGRARCACVRCGPWPVARLRAMAGPGDSRLHRSVRSAQTARREPRRSIRITKRNVCFMPAGRRVAIKKYRPPYVVRILRHRGPVLPRQRVEDEKHEPGNVRLCNSASSVMVQFDRALCIVALADGSDLTGGGGHPCASPLSGVREERAVRVKVRTHRLGRLRGEGAGSQSLRCIDGFVQVQIAL